MVVIHYSCFSTAVFGDHPFFHEQVTDVILGMWSIDHIPVIFLLVSVPYNNKIKDEKSQGDDIQSCNTAKVYHDEE